MSRKPQTLHVLQEGGKGSLLVVQTLLGKENCRERVPELEKERERERESLRETDMFWRTHMYKTPTHLCHTGSADLASQLSEEKITIKVKRTVSKMLLLLMEDGNSTEHT